MTVAAMQMANMKGRASIVAGVDAAPFLEPPERNHDPLAAAPERGVAWDRHHRKRFRRPIVIVLVLPA
jgi:hypothetical protein